MVFSSPIFLFLFLPLLFVCYSLLSINYRNLLLTVVSLLFYAWGELAFLPWLVISVAVNYVMALWIDRTRGSKRGQIILAIGIASDLILLLYFKYIGFFVTVLDYFIARLHLGPPLPIPIVLLPLGISFFTFHKISYKVDVYRGDAAAKRNPLDLALYILFFPQLIAGPIVRYNEVANQIQSGARKLDFRAISRGMTIFIIGLAKKTVIANTVAVPTDQIFALPLDTLSTPVAWLGILCYAIQIYYDFSGYSDMAVGLACCFGFEFPENFRYPYISASVTEFWRRWHISLSRWFRDYLYIPLGGNRVSHTRVYFNLAIVFLLCGFWHGAAWTFLLWGLYHGMFLVLERAFLGRLLETLPRFLRHLYLIVVILVGWALFRVSSLHAAIGYLKTMFGLHHPTQSVYSIGLYLNNAVMTALLFGILGSTPFWFRVRQYLKVEETATGQPSVFSQSVLFIGLAICLILSLLSVAGGTYDPFIYFRF